ncbi:MAG TPA: isoprenylcysteine carboxylmethyltransferase family protein [Gaiellaceae bacterium]|nr:isoprenylcysteine carboxylmethyltransferase family protein [Gaiellaceae bacterium]
MAAFAVLAFLPPRWPGAVQAAGALVAAAGAALAGWAARTLGRSLTPFPRPREDATLVTAGPFAYARHPIYGGGTLFFVGTGLVTSRAATAAAVALAALWWGKARVEERHLAARFPDYAAYRRRVRSRFLPFVV